ncbi:ferrous iron transporter B [Robiginitomaculum antarcticum]|uniref:ferrous iron transporter B n=1 Tax=Robiginitomaculum antarcticum TaxID=437507 RepID=UPI0003619E53|nr:ferrous iron transporter B [Robiginitomaculum antarcticum]
MAEADVMIADNKTRAVRLALLGAPNCGKTSLFNALTGGRAKVANYPGVTVEYRKGAFTLPSGAPIELLDLPGVYGDCGHSMDERVAIDAVRGNLTGERAPDAIMFMMDASHVSTHLHNVLQAKNYGLPVVLVLNMMDMAARDGIDIDVQQLEAQIGVPVISCVAVRAAGRAHLLDYLQEWTGDVAANFAAKPEPEPGTLKELQAKARTISRGCVSRIQKAETFTQRIDSFVLHPVLGVVILFGILFFMFQAVYSWSGPAITAIEDSFVGLSGIVGGVLPEGWIRSLISDGIIAGVGSVIVFLPQIVILFAFILLLEASGYMARAAFLVDSLMAKVGLNGRAFIPLLSSFACAIPGVMAARTIENEKDRLTTIMIAPLMTCSARWPVYLLIVGAFIPASNVGPFNLQGLVLLGLVIVGIIFAMIMAFIFKRILARGVQSSLLIELPSYKTPVFKDYLRGLWDRAMIFVNRAGRIILPASIIVWLLGTYPNRDSGFEGTFAGMIGRVLEPVFTPIGFNTEIVFSLIPSMAAREVAVGTLGTLYALEETQIDDKLGGLLAVDWSLATALAFLAWFVFAPQCLSTFAIIKKETNSWRWPLITFAYLFVLAYLASLLTYHAALSFGWG